MFPSICRVCLTGEKNLFSLFNSYCGISLGEKIMACSSVQIRADDQLPTDICSECVNRVNDSYNFKLQCEDSDSLLRQKLRENITGFDKLSFTKNELNFGQKAKNHSVECQVPYDYVNNEENGVVVKMERDPCSKSVKLEVSTDVKITSKDDIFAEIPLEYEPFVKNEHENEINDNNYSMSSDSDEKPLLALSQALSKHPNKRKLIDKEYDESGKKYTKRRKSSKNHSEVDKEVSRLPCPTCGKTYANRNSLKEHMITHGEKTFKCNYCAMSFFTAYYRARHEKVHTGEGSQQVKNLSKEEKEALRVPCPTCGKTVANKSQLKQHMKIHGEKKYKCNYCDLRFVLPSSRLVHERVHTGEKPELCNYCGKSFTTKGLLNNHKRIHTGEKPYKCTLCTSAFRLHGHLEYHMKLHLGEKNFNCTVCNKAFVNKYDVQKHMITHTRERNYSCNVCGKTMTRPHHLKLHMMTHTGVRPYKCDICEQEFIQRGYWKLHMSKHNSNNITKPSED